MNKKPQVPPSAEVEAPSTRDHSRYENRRLALQGLMKAYYGKKILYGEWTDNLDNLFKVYDTVLLNV